MDYLNFENVDYPDAPILKRGGYRRSKERLSFDAIMRMFPNYREIFVEDRFNRVFCINNTFTMTGGGSNLTGDGPTMLINIVSPWRDAFVIPRNYYEPLHVWARVLPGSMAVPPVARLS